MATVPVTEPDAAGAVVRLEAENAQLRDRMQSMDRSTTITLARATRLSQVVSVLGNVADLDQLVERAAVTVTELFSADVAVLMLGGDDELTAVGHWGVRAGDVPEAPFGLDHLASLTSAAPVLTGPADELALPEWLARYRGRHAAWARLLVGEESLGMMLIVRRGPIPFEVTDETELQAIAYRLALAVENGLLHKRMTARIAQLGRMHAFTVALAGTLEVAAVGQRIADAVLTESDVGASAVLLNGADRSPDGEAIPIATSPGAQPTPDWPRLPIETAAGVIGHVAVRVLPPHPSEAHDRLMHLLGIAGLALEKAMLYELSQEQARRDSLTGLFGHRSFHEALALLEQAGEPFSLMVLDIDDFKQVNDLYGHPAGDEGLCQVARVLRTQVRADDSVYRTGGEEFCVLLPGLNCQSAFAVAERVRRGVAEIKLPLPVTISVGLASSPLDASGREELIGRADSALYASKHAGKNRTSLSRRAGSIQPAPTNGRIDLRALHDRDPETAVHSVHVANLAVETARRMGLAGARLSALRTAAKLHDVGKVAVPHAILTKPGPLTDEEFRVVQVHPLVGAELLRGAGHLDVARFVLEHHENFDGTGYPSGLSGEEIALESRIIRVVDSFLAMTLDRPYRAAMSHPAAMDELRLGAGTSFDPDVVEAMLSADLLAAAAKAALVA